jgi:hypothetical protein
VLNLGNAELFVSAILFSPNYASDRTLYVTAGSLPRPMPTPLPGGRLGPDQPRTYGTVFRSTDDGKTWLVRDQVDAGGPRDRLESVWSLGQAITAGGSGYTLYAGTDQGMALSRNDGNNWERARDTNGFAANKYVLDIVVPQADALMAVLCPRDRVEIAPDRGGLSWRDCETGIWNAATGAWAPAPGEFASGGASRIGSVDMVPRPTGPTAIYLGADGGRVYLYSITPFP